MIGVIFEAVRAPEFDDKFYRAPLFFAMSTFGKRAVKEFDDVASFWHSNRPKFQAKLNTGASGGDHIWVDIVTENPVFFYVDRGVPGHLIYPRKDRVSGTAGTYIPGSLPGTLSVDPVGGRKVLDGYYLNLNQIIDWPGIVARNWSDQIEQKLDREYNLRDKLQEALNKATERAFSE